MLPKPAQPDGIPIWVSGRQEGPMKRAAELGDGWHPYMYTPQRCRDSFFRVKELAENAGRTLPADYTFACFIYVSLFDDLAEARKRAVAELKYRYDQEFDHLVDKYCAYGPPARVAEFLQDFIEAGANYLILAPIIPPENRREHLERFSEHVLPVLKNMEPGKVL